MINMNCSRVLTCSSIRLVLRQFSRCMPLSTAEASTAAPAGQNLIIPTSSSVDKPVSAKIEKLVTELTHLNLLEVSELSGILKRRLNLPDAAPMMSAMPAAQAAFEEEEEVAPHKVKSSFTVKLTKFDEKQKVPLIKEIKALMEGMNLVQAKKFVESAPTVVKADIGKDEAEKLKEVLTKVGAEIEIE